VPTALAASGPCYTFPSPVLFALEAALAAYADPASARARYEHYAAQGVWIRRQLRELGMDPLVAETWASPVVTTWAPPGNESSESFVERCRSWGFAIGGQSSYLAQRRLVQVATMGAITHDAFAPLFDHLHGWRAPKPILAG
jgi:aspartate aminotransferase-like enzyme